MLPPDGASGAGQQGAPAGTVGGGDAAGTGGAQQAQPGSGQGQQSAPQRNWEKDYSDLEGKYKSYERYGTPEQIENAIRWAQWAQQTKAKLDNGEYVSRADIAKLQQQQAHQEPQNDPWEQYDEYEPAQRRRLIQEEVKRLAREQFDEFKGKELAPAQQGMQGQHQLLLKVVQQMIRNPDLDPADILARATEFATLPVDKLIERAVESAVSPKQQEKAIQAAVEKALNEERALRQQEQEAKEAAQFNSRPSPRIQPSDKKTRGDRMRSHESEFNKKFNQILRAV